MPYYWHLYHGTTYKEEDEFIEVKLKRFIIYYINDLAFYYDGEINSKNEKHSIDQLCHIYCFTLA